MREAIDAFCASAVGAADGRAERGGAGGLADGFELPPYAQTHAICAKAMDLVWHHSEDAFMGTAAQLQLIFEVVYGIQDGVKKVYAPSCRSELEDPVQLLLKRLLIPDSHRKCKYRLLNSVLEHLGAETILQLQPSFVDMLFTAMGAQVGQVTAQVSERASARARVYRARAKMLVCVGHLQ
jgi:hypothetical protein